LTISSIIHKEKFVQQEMEPLRIGLSPASEPLIFQCGLDNLAAIFSRKKSNSTTSFEAQKCNATGFNIDFWSLLLISTGIQFELIPDSHNMSTGERLDNGTWTSVLGMRQQGVIHTNLYLAVITEERLRDFDFTFPILQVAPVFIVHPDNGETFWSAAVHVFQAFTPTIWLLTAITLLVLLTLSATIGWSVWRIRKYFHYIDEELTERHNKIISWNLFVYMIPNQNTTQPIRPGGITAKTLIVIMGFFILIMTDLYQGLLLAYLLKINKRHTFNDISDLITQVEEGSLKLIASSEADWFVSEMRLSSLESFQRLYEATRKNPIVYESNHTLLVDKILNEDMVHLTSELQVKND
jgi:hypothetical protein